MSVLDNKVCRLDKHALLVMIVLSFSIRNSYTNKIIFTSFLLACTVIFFLPSPDSLLELVILSS